MKFKVGDIITSAPAEAKSNSKFIVISITQDAYEVDPLPCYEEALNLAKRLREKGGHPAFVVYFDQEDQFRKVF